MISHDKLLEWLSYNSETGVFLWRKQPRQRAMPLIAGKIDEYGYRKIGVQQKTYRAHRLAWFYVYRVWPTAGLDHIDGDRSNNRISNLRVADHSSNQANSKRRVNNQTGFKGVHFHKLSGLYMARLMYRRKQIYLGYYKTPEEAHAAYLAAAKKYFGEFARAA